MKKNKTDDQAQIMIIPSLVRFELSEIAQAREDAAADQAKVDETRPVIESAITFLAAVQGENRLTKEKLAVRIQEAANLLASHRSHEVPAVRRAVLMALLSFRLTTPVDSQEKAVNQLLQPLVKDGLLKEDAEGPIEVYGKKYCPADPVLEEPEIEQIRDFTRAMVFNVRRALHDKANLRPSDLGDPTKEGVCVLFVPPQKAGVKFRPGGLLTVAQTRGPRGTVTPLDGDYKIEGPITRAQVLGVSLDFNQLNAQKPPFLKDVPEDVGKATQVFWHLINRGRDFAAWIEAAKKQKNLLTEEEFLLEGKIGVCVLDYGRAWEVRTDDAPTWWLSRPVLVAERSKNGTGNVLAIKDLPDYLSDFFKECRGNFPERGQRFEGVPQPLQAFLRAMYGKALEVSEKRSAAS